MEQKLAAALKRDDDAEDAGMHPDERNTCWTHQCWASECENDPFHTRPVPFN
ncbi:hypothetical protein [Kitasatospora sp. NPDC001683]